MREMNQTAARRLEKKRERARIWHAHHPESGRQADRKYKNSHRDLVRERNRLRKRNRERDTETSRIWRANHREELKEYGRNYYRQHHAHSIARARNKNGRRRASLRNTSVGCIDWEQIILKAQGRCAICGSVITVDDATHFDHIVPLARGGSHTNDNLQWVHARCNLKKGARVLSFGCQRY